MRQFTSMPALKVSATLMTAALLQLLGVPGAAAQLYYYQGRQIDGGDSLLYGGSAAVGINPGFLGLVGSEVRSANFLQLGGSFFSPELTLGSLTDLTFTDDTVDQDFRDEVVGTLIGDEVFTYTGAVDLNWLSASFAGPKFGGVALSLRDQVDMRGILPAALAELMLLGREAPAFRGAGSPAGLYGVGDGTELYYSHLRQATLAYGRTLVRCEGLTLSAGLSVGYVWGIGYFRTLVAGEAVRSVSAFSDFYDEIDYGDLETAVDDAPRRLLASAGGGPLFGFGAVATLGGRLEVAASVSDLGTIRWRDNTLVADGPFTDFVDSLGGGIVESFAFSEELSGAYESLGFAQGGDFDTPLNALLRLNASWQAAQGLRLSGDAAIALRDDSPEVINRRPTTIAGDLRYSVSVLGQVDFALSAGVLYAETIGARLPVGFSVSGPAGSRVSVAVPDLITYLGVDRAPYAGLSVSVVGVQF